MTFHDFRPANLATFALSQVETVMFVICSVQNRIHDLESEVLKCLNSARTIIPESFMVLLSLVVEIFHLKYCTLIIWTKSWAENGVRYVTLNACNSGTALNFCLKIFMLSTYPWYNTVVQFHANWRWSPGNFSSNWPISNGMTHMHTHTYIIA